LPADGEERRAFDVVLFRVQEVIDEAEMWERGGQTIGELGQAAPIVRALAASLVRYGSLGARVLARSWSAIGKAASKLGPKVKALLTGATAGAAVASVGPVKRVVESAASGLDVLLSPPVLVPLGVVAVLLWASK
jgi:hypothetical protein